MLNAIRKHWDVVLFVLGVTLLVFGSGVAVGRYQLWPYAILIQAKNAFDDAAAQWRLQTSGRSKYERPVDRDKGGLLTSDPARASPGYTLVTAFRDGRFGALLLDMQGQVVHRWDVAISQMYPHGPPPQFSALPPDQDANIHGVALLPDGDILLNVYTAGTVRLDRCSRIRWVLPQETHHSVVEMPDGTFIAPSRIMVTEPTPDRPRVGLGPSGFYYDDRIVQLDGDGQILRDESLLDLLRASGWDSILVMGTAPLGRSGLEDPLHLNKVEVLRTEIGGGFPIFAPGDLLISMRRPSAIMVLDGTSWHVKWGLSGPFYLQHDPQFTPDGTILIYDNAATEDRRMAGRSRLIEVDPITQEIVWSFDGRDSAPWYAYRRGTLQLLPNGNVLATDPEEGRVFEVARHNGDDIVWDWVNLLEPGFAGLVINALRFPPEAVTFLGQPCG